MDLDDSFTEKLLQRSQARKEFLHEKCTEVVPSSRKRAALVEEQQIVFGSKDVPLEESPKRHCAEAPQASYNYHDTENEDPIAAVPFHTATNTRGLAALKRNYVNGDDRKYLPSINTNEQQDTQSNVKYPKNDCSTTKNDCSEQNNEERKDSCPADDEYSDESDGNDLVENYDIKKDEDMDYSPVKTYKSEEMIKLQSNSKTEEKCISVQNGPNVLLQSTFLCTVPVKMTTSVQSQNMSVQDIHNTSMDPAELPLSARKALFEKAMIHGTPKLNENLSNQQFSVAQRAAMFENATKTSNTYKPAAVFKEPKRITIPNFSNLEKNYSPVTLRTLPQCPAKVAQPIVARSPVKSAQPVETNFPEIKGSPVKKVISPPVQSVLSPTKNVGNHTRLIQQKLMEGSSHLIGKENAAKAAEERKQEISSLVNQWEKISSQKVENNSDAEKSSFASEEHTTYESDDQDHFEYDEESIYGDENVEEEEKLQAKDAEFVDDSDSVFGSNQGEIGSLRSLESTSSCEPGIWERGEDSESTSSQPPRSTGSSVSYSDASSYCDDNPTRSQSCTNYSSARSSEVRGSAESEGTPSSSRKSKNSDVTIVRTVSEYRKGQKDQKVTPVRKIIRQENVLSPESSNVDYTEIIKEKIKAFQEDILRQQTVISQTSQALNLCCTTAEFSGSSEQVEGERLLLIATQKRQALLNEIQRLKTYSSQGEMLNNGEGTMIITDMQLPLKREFMASQLAGRGNDTVHYFLCLIRHGAQVMVTQMMSTDDKVSDGALCFTNHIKLQDLHADFSVVFEVYALQTKKEVMPHEKKYHIKREHSKIRLAPKVKRFDSKRTIPVSSPGGPNAVRSPSFGVVGFTRFTLQNWTKKSFTLDKVAFSSPLEGILKVKLHLHAEHKVTEKGFLTLFSEKSKLGVWYRRWFLLDSNHLTCWNYPDDENKKEPVGVVDLKQCVTAEVEPVAQSVCARPHTFQLVTVRPYIKGDENTLISTTDKTLTTTKFLLSADTKEERILWCNKINEALRNVRKWDPQALKPVEALQI